MQTIAIGNVRLDGGTQPRTQIDLFTVQEYAEDLQRGADFPAVEAVFDGVAYWLWDGFHRYHAHVKAGRGSISDALRTQKTTDSHGNKVRLHHCVETTVLNDQGESVQCFLWAHVDDAPDDHLLRSLEQRRSAVVKDLRSLRADLDFINARRQAKGRPPIQMTFDFRKESDAHAVA